MRTQTNSLTKRIAAALTAAAVMIMSGVAPAEAVPLNPIGDGTWVTQDADGNIAAVEPAVPATTATVPSETTTVPSETATVPSETATVPSETATVPSATAPKPTTKPQVKQVTNPELAEEVSFKHVRTTDEGLEEYKLDAKVILPADENGKPHPLEDLTFQRVSGDLAIEEVKDPIVDGRKLDDDSVTIFDYPENATPEERKDIPADVKGDLITIDTAEVVERKAAEDEREIASAPQVEVDSGAPLPEVDPTTVSARVFSAKASETPVKFELKADGATAKTIKPSDPLGQGKARVVVQVGGDWLKGKTNNATKVMVRKAFGREENIRQNTVYLQSAGQKAVLRLYKPVDNKRWDIDDLNTKLGHDAALVPVDEPWATCESDENGECVFDIPVNDPSYPWNYYWVGMEKASEGYYKIDELRVGGSGATNVQGLRLKYAFATPPLEAGQTYYSGVQYDGKNDYIKVNGFNKNSFMYSEGTGGEAEHRALRYRNSTGVMMQTRRNPVPGGCKETKIGFIVDTSESMGNQGMDSVRQVLAATVTGLKGKDVSVGFASFATDSPGYTNPSNILESQSLKNGVPKEVTDYIKKLTPTPFTLARDMDTDWEEGLQSFVGQGYDIVYLITDGNPTRTNTRSTDSSINNHTGSGVDTYFNSVELPVGVANVLKAEGTRVVPVGVPSKWTYNPEIIDVVAGTFTFGLWALIKQLTDLNNVKQGAEGDEQLEVSEANLAALSGPNRADPKKVDLLKDDYVLDPDPGALVRGMVDAVPDCKITVERRFYPGPETDIAKVKPTPENTRALTKDEAEKWPFNFEGQPNNGDKELKTDYPKLADNPLYPGADPENYFSEFVLNGKSSYKYVDFLEEKGAVPNDWIPVKVATGKNAQGACVGLTSENKGIVTDQSSKIENLDSAEKDTKTNDFKATDIPLEGGCHYIVYYMKAPPEQPGTFNFDLSKVNGVPKKQGDAFVYDPLAGAQFELTYLDADNPQKIAGSVEGAQFKWENLATGRYKLTETRAPDGGYLLLSKPVFFRVKKEGDQTKLFILANENDKDGTEVTSDNAGTSLTFPVIEFAQTSSDAGIQVSMKVANSKVGELPKTGGHGVFAQILLGLLVVLTGAFAARRRGVV